MKVISRLLAPLILLVNFSISVQATEIIEPAFEDATLTGDLNARILAGGPMIAYTTPREVGIWVSTAKEARVRIAYYDETAVEKVRVTAEVQTSREDAFTVLFRCDRVEPGRKYFYKLYIDGKTHRLPFERSFSTPIAAEGDDTEHRVLFLGAHAVNDPVYAPTNPVKSYAAMNAATKLDPTAMFWVGNSTLVRESDNSSTAGYHLRYSFARNWSGLKSLQATVPQYAAPAADDLGAASENGWIANPGIARTTFDRFWPVAGRARDQDLSYSFNRGRVAFFVVDAFSHRSPDQRYGNEQVNWLTRGLEASNASALRIVSLGESLENGHARSESKQLLRALKDLSEASPILLTSAGTGQTVRIDHSPTLTEVVLGPFSRIPTPSAPVRSSKVIAEGNVFGLLTWSGKSSPSFELRSADGTTLNEKTW